jgi:hypothetical protein
VYIPPENKEKTVLEYIRKTAREEEEGHTRCRVDSRKTKKHTPIRIVCQDHCHTTCFM